MSRKPGRARSRVRTQWLALGAALVVLAGVLVAWGLSNAADRVQVVQVAQGVRAGDLIAATDLTITGVAYDGAVQGLVPADSLDALVGRIAAIDLQAGAIVQAGMWRDAPELAAGEHSVGALLASGRYPAGLARGDTALAASIDAAADTTTDTTITATNDITTHAVEVRVIDVEVGADGGLLVTLAVPAGQSVAIAQLAATDQLLLVGNPTVAGA